jgi:hypothetical protein
VFPYWLLFSIFAFGAIRTQRVDQAYPGRTPLLLAAALVATCMIGFRYRVGGDWSVYQDIFEYIGYVDFTSALSLSNSDPAYSLINWLAQRVGAEVWMVNLVCGAILVAGTVRFAGEQPNPWLVFVVAVPYLLIVVGMGYTRQAAAIGFELFALTAFLNGKNLRFLAYMAVAAAFHKSAVIVLPIVGLAVTRNRVLIGLLVVIVSYFLYSSLIAARLDMLTRNYVEAQLESQGAAVRIAMNVVPALLFLAFSRRFGLNDLERNVWRNMAIAALGALVGLLTLASSTVVDRLALYLVPLQLLVLGRLPSAFPSNRQSSAMLIFLVIAYSAAIQIVWLNFANNARLWVPYRLYPFTASPGEI